MDPMTNGFFINAQKECAELCASKHKDYGPDNINAHGAIGVVVRLGDKQRRLEHLFRDVRLGATAEEIARLEMCHDSVEDTLKDMANYALIALLVLRGQWKGDEDIYGTALWRSSHES